MTPRRPRTLPLAILSLLALTSAALAGCTPEAAPTPTPAFASEEEAFAAAEEVYQGYIDALNAVDFSNPATFEVVYSVLAEDAESSTRETFSEFHAENVSVTGSTSFDSFVGVSSVSPHDEIDADVCLDVREVGVFDEAGDSLVAADRPPRQPMRIEFAIGNDDDTLKIVSMTANEEYQCDD